MDLDFYGSLPRPPLLVKPSVRMGPQNYPIVMCHHKSMCSKVNLLKSVFLGLVLVCLLVNCFSHGAFETFLNNDTP